MALNFPSSPTNGDTYEGYTWNATVGAWQSSAEYPAIANITDVTITAPTEEGQILAYDESETAWVNQFLSSSMLPSHTHSPAEILRSRNLQSGTSYDLLASDASKFVELDNTSSITVTVPSDSFIDMPIGTEIYLVQIGTGQVSVTDDGNGVVINATPGLKLRTQWSGATLLKRQADSWILLGDLSA